jgi:hypothetical protein
MKVALIGMGASAFGSFIALEEYEHQIDSVDIFSKKTLTIKKKKRFDNKSINSFYKTLKSKSLIPPKINIQSRESDTDKLFEERFEAMNLWGASCLPYSRKNLNDNHLFYDDYKAAYEKISQHISISGDKKDQIEKLFGMTYTNENEVSIDSNIQKMITLLNVHENNFKVFSGKARLALKHRHKNFDSGYDNKTCECSTNNCQLHDIFLEPDIEMHIRKSKLKTKIFYNYVAKINLKQSSLSYIEKKNQKLKNKKYDLIIVCTGPKETIQLIQRSTKVNNFKISDSKSYLFPIFAPNFNIFKKNINYFSLTNGISIIESIKEKEQYFVQIYKVSEDLWKAFLPSILWPLTNFLKNLIYFGVLYLDDRDRVDYNVNFVENEFTINKISKDSKKKVRILLRNLAALLKNKFFIFSSICFEKRTSHHFGRLIVDGSYLQDWHKKFNSPKIVFSGAVNFTKMPSSSPTFTVMAEGYLNIKNSVINKKLK